MDGSDMARLSPAYYRYHASPEWAAAKACHWRNPLTLKSCVVCGARRGERPLDMHELAYRTIGREDEARSVRRPRWRGVEGPVESTGTKTLDTKTVDGQDVDRSRRIEHKLGAIG